MLATIKRIGIRLLTLPFDHPLPSSSANEVLLIDDLRRSFRAFSFSGARNVSPSEDYWLSQSNRLRELVLSGDPREFLRWGVIQKTMFVTFGRFIKKELAYLRNLPTWETRWRKAVRESPVGHPVPYLFYPSSSATLIQHAYHCAQFEEKTAVCISEMEYIFEFGGGYGSMCRLAFNLGFRGKYVIFDLPHLSVLQKFFLKSIGLAVQTADEFGTTGAGVVCISDLEVLQSLLAGRDKGQNSMFVATWSLSEAPIKLRNAILPLVAQFTAYLIAYQDQFGEVNNREYFGKWRELMNGEVVWHAWEIEYLLGNSYLVGKRPTNTPT